MRVPRRAGRSGERGTTLIEIVAGLTTFVTLALVILGVERAALQGMRASDRAGEAIERSNRIVDRIDREIRMAGDSQVQVPGALGLEAAVDGTAYSEMRFRKAIGFTTAGITWGNQYGFRWTLDGGETDDDVDNDGDGLADEGSIWFLTESGGTVEVASRILGFSMELDDSAVLLTVEVGMPVTGGAPLRHQVVRTVRLRNN